MTGLPTARLLRADGKHVFYVASRGWHQWYGCVDDHESQLYDRVWDDTARFNPDGKGFAFVAERQGKLFVVVDGVEGRNYDEIIDGLLCFSPNGRRIAYTARRDNLFQVVLDGAEGPAYTSAGRPFFSPHFRRIAYTAVRQEKQFIVLDGVESGPHVGLRPQSLVFSPNGRISHLPAERLAPFE